MSFTGNIGSAAGRNGQRADGHVLLVGGGVIGKGWAVQLLAHGHRVVLADPAVGADEVARHVRQNRHAVESLGGDLDGWESRLHVVHDTGGGLEAALDGAVWVQESGPEDPGFKSRLAAWLDERLSPEVVIASSTSGTMPSALAAECTSAPGRVVVGHPFHPVPVIPLVEVVGNAHTADETAERACDFYRSLGKRPVRVRREVPGHLANRLQAALWREAYSLVERGVATVADVDAAITNGPGLRWALLGPLLGQHLGGGPGGMAHTLEHLGPPAQEWMDDLRDARLSPELVSLLVDGVDREVGDRGADELSAVRDALLVRLLQDKRDAGRSLP
ncbi:3-hydroxyacyl-CoA dehydrogenase NAD-binding domain-containing protein [Nocardiopsis chromatogenes]|uniref:3-hydroxyacyl-CoA dehydrogenase NAD-binding domain-containing protein n=1 Tax=Nocardiopsis chromatogenes TaxID=280239 RepID=UPI000345E034|nr:3-hydroxyacyl-CoA dehydrogenase NAD-binding domain-containing protein [Nocardiopsis chromatogenes]